MVACEVPVTLCINANTIWREGEYTIVVVILLGLCKDFRRYRGETALRIAQSVFMGILRGVHADVSHGARR